MHISRTALPMWEVLVMAVFVMFKAPSGSQATADHDSANMASVREDGLLFVQKRQADGVIKTLAGYSPGVWSFYTVDEDPAE